MRHPARVCFTSSGEIEVPVTAEYSSTPPEPTNNWGGTLDIESLYVLGVNVISFLGDEHIRLMEEELKELIRQDQEL